MIFLGVRRKPPSIATSAGPANQAGTQEDERPAFGNEVEALRSPHFWSIVLPFSLALTAQVGFIINQVAFLLPHLGIDGAGIAIALTTIAAFAGRLALAPIIDKVNQRHASSVTFVWQAAGLAMMLAMPNNAAALYIGCVVVGLSVGNIVSLPPLVIQHEFAPRSFRSPRRSQCNSKYSHRGCGTRHVRSRPRSERELCGFTLPLHRPATGEFLNPILQAPRVRAPVGVIELARQSRRACQVARYAWPALAPGVYLYR